MVFKVHEFFNYGCNCYFEGNWDEISGEGLGYPIDPLDATCLRFKKQFSNLGDVVFIFLHKRIADIMQQNINFLFKRPGY